MLGTQRKYSTDEGRVNGKNHSHSPDLMTSQFTERITLVHEEKGKESFQNVNVTHTIKTSNVVPKLGVMLVGFGGNNGSTLVAGLLANKHQVTWQSKLGEQKPNYYGSFTQCATAHIGFKFDDKSKTLSDVFKPVKDLVPLVKPEDLIISGWDISSKDLYESCLRAQVLEPDLLMKLKPYLSDLVPMPAALNPEFIASNQAQRADHVLQGTNREIIEQLRQDMRNMKEKVDKVVILWTANTEMYYLPEIANKQDLLRLIDNNASLPSSVLYCVAAIEEGLLYLNGSPQNTFHPGVIQYAKEKGAYLAGSDFKSGQTRFKTIMSDYLIGSGLRLSSVVSYNHLGNNDGKNLSEDKCFQSKKISKGGVLDDAIKSNPILYPSENGQSHIDHEVVIKYVPFVGDSKRALDEYSSLIFMNGVNTISTYNICEDSLLAVPLMLDMILLGEFFTRVTIDEESLGPVLSYLSFFFKAPVTNHPEFVVNSFSRQRETLVNFLKAAAGYQPGDQTLLSFKF